MEKLKNIEECLIGQIQAQCGDLKQVNAKELGEVVDMVKDLEEAMYYCSIIDAMDKSNEEKRSMNVNYYMEGHNGQPRYYVPYMEYAPYMMRDEGWRDSHMYGGRSGASRRMYIEGKQYHNNNDQQSMKELEHYIQDLGEDLTDMIKESTTEEKQVLSTKLQQLATKINK